MSKTFNPHTTDYDRDAISRNPIFMILGMVSVKKLFKSPNEGYIRKKE